MAHAGPDGAHASQRGLRALTIRSDNPRERESDNLATETGGLFASLTGGRRPRVRPAQPRAEPGTGERMAKFEGAVEGFLAGRRERDA